MNNLSSYSTGNNWVAEMLDLIERCAPKLIACGGGALMEEKFSGGANKIQEEERNQIIELHRCGRTSQDIANLTGRAPSTIDRVIRPYREYDRRRKPSPI